MKKVLSLLLSLCLVITGMASVLTQGALASGVIDHENTAYWGTTANSTISVSDSALTLKNKVSAVTDADRVYNGGTSALYFTPSWGQYIGLKFQGLKANTGYRFSFKHKVFSSGNYIGKVSNTATYYKLLGNGVYIEGDDDAYVNKSFGTITGIALNQNAESAFNFDQWNEYSLSFNVGDDTSAYFLTRLYANRMCIDDVVVAEALNTVEALSSDTTMGTATVANKNPNLTNFAVGDTAVFTATPIGIYAFKGWYDENGQKVSNEAIYETVLTASTTLTALFAPSDNIATISFNSNGGSSVEPMQAVPGALINMPEDPTKDGFVFAGWYLDEALANRFLGRYVPNADTTLYAKWINGTYMNFESSTTGTVVSGFDTSYEGNKAYKISADSQKAVQIVMEHDTNRPMSTWASLGDDITISFKYKLVSGSISFYPRTSVTTPDYKLRAYWTQESGESNNWANGFAYKSRTLDNVSEEWQTFSASFSLNSESYLDGKYTDKALTTNLTADDILDYIMIFITPGKGTTEIYIDEFTAFRTIEIPINYETEAVRLESTNTENSLQAAVVGSTLTFTAACDESVTPTVKYGDTILTPVNGIYTIEAVNEDLELTVSAAGLTPAQNHAPGVGLNGEDLTSYNSEVFSVPLWEGDTVYHEAVMFVNSIDGIVQTTKELLYPIDDIVSVRNQYLNTWYVKGVDFDVVDGRLVWLEDGKCPIWTGPLTAPADAGDDYYDPALNYGGSTSASGWYTLEEGGDTGLYLLHDGNHEKQTIYVTYKHTKTWADLGVDGYTPEVPENQSNDMTAFYDKLATGEDINVLVYGASTATGCSSTGRNVNYELFSKSPDETTGEYTVTLRNEKGSGIAAPTFFEQATAQLVKDYGNNNKIDYYNIAHGGTSSPWGDAELKNRVEAINKYYGKTIVPDIIYIKFAGNDVRLAADTYKAHIEGMILQFKELFPNATIVLISGKVNNEKCYIFGDYRENVANQEKALCELAEKYQNCVVAKTNSVWTEIVKSKDYEDYLSNNINHANDFWAKTTAQIIVGSIKKQVEAPLKTAYNGLAALRTASESSTGKNGLRIYNEIKCDWFESAEIVEFGSIAALSQGLNGAEPELNGTKVAKGVAYKKGALDMLLWETTESSYVFTSYLTGISDDYYGESFSIRTYAIDKDGNVYYGTTQELSVFDVANAIDNQNSADGNTSQADTDAFYVFVTESNAAEYKDWCTENTLSVGSLFTARYN